MLSRFFLAHLGKLFDKKIVIGPLYAKALSRVRKLFWICRAWYDCRQESYSHCSLVDHHFFISIMFSMIFFLKKNQNSFGTDSILIISQFVCLLAEFDKCILYNATIQNRQLWQCNKGPCLGTPSHSSEKIWNRNPNHNHKCIGGQIWSIDTMK